MQNKVILHSFFFLMLIGISSCEDGTSYEIPTIYDFENVSYQGQLDRIGMLVEMKNYLAIAEDGQSTLEYGRLASMYANSNPVAAGWQGNYDATKQLKEKTASNQQSLFEQLLENAANDSQNNRTASEGTSGILTSLDGEKTYFVNARGLEYKQVIEKGLMGACFLYQSTSVYLGAGKMNADNTDLEPGVGTAMEHHWDEAFGYLGVPIDFPENKLELNFWGKYCNDRNSILDSNSSLMNAFISGRAAISNQDMVTRDAEIRNIRKEWDRVAAGSALHYINSAISNYNDMAVRAHALSEAVAFAYGVKFNPDALADEEEINIVLEKLGGNKNFLEMDFYSISISDLENAKNTWADIYGWGNVKDQF